MTSLLWIALLVCLLAVAEVGFAAWGKKRWSGRMAILAGLGAISVQVGGAPVWNGTWRVAFWGAVAMASLRALEPCLVRWHETDFHRGQRCVAST